MGFVISSHHTHLKSLFELVTELALKIPLEGLCLSESEYQSDKVLTRWKTPPLWYLIRYLNYIRVLGRYKRCSWREALLISFQQYVT